MANDGKKEVMGVVLFFCAIILGLMYYLPEKITGVVGNFLRSVGFGFFGFIALILPFFLFYAAIDLFIEKRERVAFTRVKAAILILVCFASLFAAITMNFDHFRTLCIPEGKEVPSVTSAVSLLWRSGLDKDLIRAPGDSGVLLPGGLIGGLIATGIQSVCGKAVTILIMIAFTLSQVILIFHVSIKKTAQNIGKAAKRTYTSARENMNRRGKANAYRTDVPRQPQYSASPSPFVMTGGNREVPIVNGDNVVPDLPVEYDPFNVNHPNIPVDQQSGFLNIAQQSPSSVPQNEMQFGDRTISYGDRKVPVGENSNSADFSYNSEPHHLPYVQHKKTEMYSFDKKDDGRQKDFYDLGENGKHDNTGYYDHFEQGIPQVDSAGFPDEDDVSLYHYDYTNEEGPYEINNTNTPGVRTPNVPVGLTENLGGNIVGKPRGSNVATAMNTGNQVRNGSDEIKINTREEHEGFSETEGRKLKMQGVSSNDSSPDIPQKPLRGKVDISNMIAPSKILDHEPKMINPNNDTVLKEKAHKLEQTLKSFGIEAKVVHITHGPTITRFEVTIATGTKVAKVLNLENDIQLSMAALSVRIEAPIPGKSAIGIEIPNDKPLGVKLRPLLETAEFKNSAPLNVALGRDIPGDPMYCNLSKMPHLLIAGATGSGKSVCLNTILVSILCKASPNDVRLIMVDPKVVELQVYNDIPHLIMPVVTDSKKAANTLKWAVIEMERRYSLFADANVRDLEGFNEYSKLNSDPTLPLILIVIDEFADLMLVAAKEVEEQVLRLAAKARAAGIHLILATQRPSVDVITGVLKSNLPSRIALQVASGVDSKTILDQPGAQNLLGKGDMLYLPSSAPKPIRGQCAYVSDVEVAKITNYLKTKFGPLYDDDIIRAIDCQVEGSSANTETSNGSSGGNSEDDLLEAAVEVVLEQKVASVSILQRRLGVGYPRAARLIDVMEQKHYIGPFEGSKPRKVLIDPAQWLEIKARNGN